MRSFVNVYIFLWALKILTVDRDESNVGHKSIFTTFLFISISVPSDRYTSTFSEIHHSEDLKLQLL